VAAAAALTRFFTAGGKAVTKSPDSYRDIAGFNRNNVNVDRHNASVNRDNANVDHSNAGFYRGAGIVMIEIGNFFYGNGDVTIAFGNFINDIGIFVKEVANFFNNNEDVTIERNNCSYETRGAVVESSDYTIERTEVNTLSGGHASSLHSLH
jgi:hypothetical protein